MKTLELFSRSSTGWVSDRFILNSSVDRARDHMAPVRIVDSTKPPIQSQSCFGVDGRHGRRGNSPLHSSTPPLSGPDATTWGQQDTRLVHDSVSLRWPRRRVIHAKRSAFSSHWKPPRASLASQDIALDEGAKLSDSRPQLTITVQEPSLTSESHKSET